jgi:hypothetical protein
MPTAVEQRRRSAVRVALLGAVVLGWGLPCVLRGQQPADREPKYWLVCPRCGLEMTCPPEWVKTGCMCPRCGRTDAHMDVTTSPPSREGEASGGGSRVVRWLAITVAVLLAAAWVAMKCIQAAQARADRDDLRPSPCPVCGAILKYRETDAGLTVTCPACGEKVTYNPPQEEEAPGPESGTLEAWRQAMKRARAARRYGKR